MAVAGIAEVECQAAEIALTVFEPLERAAQA
jgi:hypothetical protein